MMAGRKLTAYYNRRARERCKTRQRQLTDIVELRAGAVAVTSSDVAQLERKREMERRWSGRNQEGKRREQKKWILGNWRRRLTQLVGARNQFLPTHRGRRRRKGLETEWSKENETKRKRGKKDEHPLVWLLLCLSVLGTLPSLSHSSYKLVRQMQCVSSSEQKDSQPTQQYISVSPSLLDSASSLCWSSCVSRETWICPQAPSACSLPSRSSRFVI